MKNFLVLRVSIENGGKRRGEKHPNEPTIRVCAGKQAYREFLTLDTATSNLYDALTNL